MKTLAYHGTTADNLHSILREGLKSDKSKVWTCSHDAVYCWSKNHLKDLQDNGGCDDGERETVEDWHEEFLQQAFDSASVNLGRADDCRAVVVVFEVDDCELCDDDSCPNMELANCVYRDIEIEEIKAVYVSNELGLLKGYFLALMLDRPLFNYYPTNIERKIADCLKHAEIYNEDIQDLLEWEQLPLPTMQTV